MRRKKSKPISSKLSVFDKIILGVNIIAALLLLLSYLAPDTDPRDFMIIALLGLAYPVILIFNILLSIYWLIRKSYFSFISLITIVLGYNTFQSFFGLRKTSFSDAKNPESIRVMTYNVHEFTGIESFEGQSILSDVIKIIKPKQPDIIGFNEYNAKSVDSLNVTDSLKKHLGLEFHKLSPYKISSNRGDAIFSKYPIIKSGDVSKKGFMDLKANYADIQTPQYIFRIYYIHLEGVHFKRERNGLVHGSEGVGVFTKLSRISRAFVIRSYEVDKIRRHVEDCPYPYIIIGDLDDTPNSYAVNSLANGIKNSFVEKGSGWGSTLFNNVFKLQIDYILTNSNFNVLGYQSINEKVSDHKPVIADIQLNK